MSRQLILARILAVMVLSKGLAHFFKQELTLGDLPKQRTT